MTVYQRGQIEGLVLIRDGAAMIADGVSKLLETTEPKEAQKLTYDISKIKTVQAEGPSGPYKKANNQDGNDYKLLIEDLKAHDGKITRDGFWIWLFNDGKTAGLKPSKR